MKNRRLVPPPQLLALFALAPGLAFAGVAGSSQSAIIHGDAVDTDVFPSAAQLIIGGSLGGQDVKAPACTATLIAPDVALTAGHCLEDYPLTFGIIPLDGLTFWITFEEDLGYMVDQSSGGSPELPDDAVEAAAWVQHPGFDMQGMVGIVPEGPGKFDDIALIFLDRAVTDRPHAWLPTAEEDASLFEDQVVDIVGYGQRSAESGGPFQPPEPGTAFVRVHAESWINELGEFEMQIGGDSDSSRKCHGDSGGPSYARVETDLVDDVRVVGVTSHAYDERDCLVGGVDTRVGPYLDWIEDEMVVACEDGVRLECDEPGILRPAPSNDADGGGVDGEGCRSSMAGGASASALALFLLGGLVRRRRS